MAPIKWTMEPILEKTSNDDITIWKIPLVSALHLLLYCPLKKMFENISECWGRFHIFSRCQEMNSDTGRHWLATLVCLLCCICHYLRESSSIAEKKEDYSLTLWNSAPLLCHLSPTQLAKKQKHLKSLTPSDNLSINWKIYLSGG